MDDFRSSGDRPATEPEVERWPDMSLAEGNEGSAAAIENERDKRTSRNEPLGDGQRIDLLGGVTTLAKVDPLNVLLGHIVLSIGKGLNLVLHEVEDVEPGISASVRESRQMHDSGTDCM